MRRVNSRIIALVALVVATVATPVPAGAQRADSGTVGVRPAPRTATRPLRDSTITGPPISPRRAFLYSLLVPGLGQSKLDRPHAGALYVAVEAVSWAMIHKTGKALAASKAFPDSVIVRYDKPPNDTSPPVPVREANQLALRVRSRKIQVEDWVAVLLFNHFFSGADAFVAAQLWDLPIVLSADPAERGGRLGAKVSW
jgi:hypothetical protein